MKIDYSKKPFRYYDINGDEIRSGDFVMIDGTRKAVGSTDDGHLGYDATNHLKVEKGLAVPFEYGLYQFEETDKPILCK